MIPGVAVPRRHRLLRLPVLRGVVALDESMRIGFRALSSWSRSIRRWATRARSSPRARGSLRWWRHRPGGRPTREPDHRQLEVAIIALTVVLSTQAPEDAAAGIIGVEVVA